MGQKKGKKTKKVRIKDEGQFGGKKALEFTDLVYELLDKWNGDVLEHPVAMKNDRFKVMSRKISGLMYDLYSHSSIVDSSATEKGLMVFGFDHLDKDEQDQILKYDTNERVKNFWSDEWCLED